MIRLWRPSGEELAVTLQELSYPTLAGQEGIEGPGVTARLLKQCLGERNPKNWGPHLYPLLL